VTPNPFRDQARIHFRLPVSTDARIDIYDVNGNFVERIADRYFSGDIDHAVIWKPLKVVPGMYFIQLTAGRHVSTVKATFIQ
jgi:hypothetical protein